MKDQHDSNPHVVITYPFAFGGVNGANRLLREVARNLGRLGATVVLIPVSASPYTDAPRPSIPIDREGFEFDEELAEEGVRVLRVSQNPRTWALDGMPVRRAISALIKERQVDLVLSFYQEAAFLPGFLRKKGIRFGYIGTWQSYEMALQVPEYHDEPTRRRAQRQNQRLVIEPYRQAEIVFANSEFTRSELVNVVGVAPERITICPLGIERSFVEIPRRRPTKIRRLLFFGRLIRSKGIYNALEALGMLASSGLTDWEFRVFGPGNRDWIRSSAEDYGIASRVHVGAPLNDDEVRLELEQADLAILPSHAESFGLSIAESQAAGLAVIGFEAAAVPEVVENGVTGWLAPFCDVEQLSLRIQEAIENPTETYLRGLAGRERVHRLFRWENSARIILDWLKCQSRSTCPQNKPQAGTS